jgi:hypothetical protein
MATKISLNNRIKIGFAFAIVFLLVIATNRLDKKRFSTINETLTSVFEDRLVAKGYLYELNNIFHEQEKRLMLNSTSITETSNYHDEVTKLSEAFQATKLTNEEKSSLNNFRTHIKELKTLEQSLTESNADDVKPKVLAQINRIQNDLDILADIQVSEGESLTKFAQSSLNTSSNVSKIEIAVIILIGIIVQFIIFYK